MPSYSVRVLFSIIALAMVGVRLGGIHLHLCFDGQEPPASLHVEHKPAHHDYRPSESPHQDQDVELLAEAFLKKVGPDTADILGGAFGLIVVPLNDRSEPAFFTGNRPTGPPHFMVPPLRGPPA